MAAHELLSLDLRSPILYLGIENPPLAGAPLEGSVALPLPGGGLRQAALGLDLAEGEEELFAFDEDELVRFDPDEGPRLAWPLPPPRFYGSSSSGAAGGQDRAGPGQAGTERRLPAGAYLFLQFRPLDEAELAAGIEWFAREAWWEGDRGRGPYLLRRIKEDGRLATQVLRRASR